MLWLMLQMLWFARRCPVLRYAVARQLEAENEMFRHESALAAGAESTQFRRLCPTLCTRAVALSQLISPCPALTFWCVRCQRKRGARGKLAASCPAARA